MLVGTEFASQSQGVKWGWKEKLPPRHSRVCNVPLSLLDFLCWIVLTRYWRSLLIEWPRKHVGQTGAGWSAVLLVENATRDTREYLCCRKLERAWWSAYIRGVRVCRIDIFTTLWTTRSNVSDSQAQLDRELRALTGETHHAITPDDTQMHHTHGEWKINYCKCTRKHLTKIHGCKIDMNGLNKYLRDVNWNRMSKQQSEGDVRMYGVCIHYAHQEIGERQNVWQYYREWFRWGSHRINSEDQTSSKFASYKGAGTIYKWIKVVALWSSTGFNCQEQMEGNNSAHEVGHVRRLKTIRGHLWSNRHSYRTS